MSMFTLNTPFLSDIAFRNDSRTVSRTSGAMPQNTFSPPRFEPRDPLMRSISCHEGIYSFLGYKLPLLERSSSTLNFCFVGEQIIHCLFVDTPVVFDLLMPELSTRFHLKTRPAPTFDLERSHRHIRESLAAGSSGIETHMMIS